MKPADALFDYAISQFLAWYAHAGRPNPSLVAPRAAWAHPAGLRDREEREAPVPEVEGLTYSGTKLGRTPIYFDAQIPPDGPMFLFNTKAFTEAFKAANPDPGPCVWPIR